MTTYATNNPIGSMDPKDLFDNAQNLDFAVNDITKAFWKDRFGRSRPTMFGMEQAFSAQLLSQQQRFDNFIQSSGYKVIGDYTAGPLTINEYNQLIRYQGELYKLTAATPLGFTTTGNDATSWANDSAHFVSVGDAALRQELAAPGGAALVGPGVMSRGLDKFSILQGRSGEAFAGDYTRGIAVQLNEPITGSGSPVSTAQINLIEINADRLNVVDDTSAGTKVDGFMVLHRFGGAGSKGGRHAIEAILDQNDITESSNSDRNYVGIAGTSTSSKGDGGTSAADAKGTYYGGNFVGILNPGATFTQVVTGAEFNAGIKTGASANIRTGLQIGSLGNVRGGVIDAALMVGCGASNPAWRSGLHFGKQSGGSPFDATSRAIRVDVDQVDSIISISTTTVVNKLIDSQKVILTPSVFAMRDSAAYVEIGSDTTAGSTQLRFRTSGTGVANDASIIVSGGNSVANSGNLEFKAGNITYSCSQRPNVDNVYDYGAANFRGRTAYFGTGSINTSDDRHKPIKEKTPDSLLDAWEMVDWGTRFKFDDAIAIKGEDGARWHFGLIAQRVEAVFAEHGIDGFSLGLLCYDEWEDQFTKVHTNEGATVTKTRTVQRGIEVKKVRKVSRPVMTKVIVDVLVDDVLEDGTRIKRVVSEEHETPKTVMVPVLLPDGTPHPQQPYVSEVVTEEVEEEFIDVELVDVEEEYTEPAEPEFTEVLVSAAGSRYGIRYEEALSLEAALQRRNYERLLAKHESLEERIKALEGASND
ncbi:TPA: tail fiber domain-containing protein [Escherichia coli]